jgi:murein L,D-transpeptidase YcbB/YkuD
MLFAVSQGEAELPNIRNGVVDSPTEQPASPSCTAEEAAAIIVASGLSVAAWQQQQGIVDDGVIGPQTINAACG